MTLFPSGWSGAAQWGSALDLLLNCGTNQHGPVPCSLHYLLRDLVRCIVCSVGIPRMDSGLRCRKEDHYRGTSSVGKVDIQATTRSTEGECTPLWVAAQVATRKLSTAYRGQIHTARMGLSILEAYPGMPGRCQNTVQDIRWRDHQFAQHIEQGIAGLSFMHTRRGACHDERSRIDEKPG